MTFDPTKPVRTRDGRPARIVCTDKVSGVSSDGPCILALTLDYGGIEETPRTYKRSGQCFSHQMDGRHDLVNYDPYEITDEEAELIIDILFWRGSISSKVCPTADKIRKKVAASEIYNEHYIVVRDMVIKHRKK